MPTFDDLLAPYPPQVQATARRARALILDVLPDATERVRLGWKNATFGRGAAMGDTLFAICPQRTRVNLNLCGAGLPDPAGLVEGTGVRVRHVKLAAPDAMDAPALRTLLEAAVAAGATLTPTTSDRGQTAAPPAPPAGYKLDVSRTVDATLGDLFAAWTEPAERARWLAMPDGTGALVVRRATPMKSVRAPWPAGGSLAVTFEARGERRARVNVEHSRVRDAAALPGLRAFWRAQLDQLAAQLAADHAAHHATAEPRP